MINAIRLMSKNRAVAMLRVNAMQNVFFDRYRQHQLRIKAIRIFNIYRSRMPPRQRRPYLHLAEQVL